MKTGVKVFMTVCAALCVIALSCASGGGSGGGGGAAAAAAPAGSPGVFTWGSFTDSSNGGSSRISLIEDVEDFGNGEILPTYSISGEITSQYQYGYAGWFAFPDEETRIKMAASESFSFQVLGDGQTYSVMFCTTDIEDHAHYGTTFATKKDQVTTVTVKLDSLKQPGDWGVKKPFNKANATQYQFQTTNNGTPGTFKLKVWDIRIN
jgi:hypothetical protein